MGVKAYLPRFAAMVWSTSTADTSPWTFTYPRSAPPFLNTPQVLKPCHHGHQAKEKADCLIINIMHIPCPSVSVLFIQYEIPCSVKSPLPVGILLIDSHFLNAWGIYWLDVPYFCPDNSYSVLFPCLIRHTLTYFIFRKCPSKYNGNRGQKAYPLPPPVRAPVRLLPAKTGKGKMPP